MSNLGRRLARLESVNGEGGYLQLVTLDDLVGDYPVQPWPDDLAAIQFANGAEHSRRDGETVEAFRHRLSVEHGVRGPAGALPFAIVESFSRVMA